MTDLERYRELLTTERARILGNITSLQDELHTSQSADTDEHGLETHLGDAATATFLRERDISIEGHEEHVLEEVDVALARIEAGTYGTCVDCGTVIPDDRLDAIPWAIRCYPCAQKAEA